MCEDPKEFTDTIICETTRCKLISGNIFSIRKGEYAVLQLQRKSEYAVLQLQQNSRLSSATATAKFKAFKADLKINSKATKAKAKLTDNLKGFQDKVKAEINAIKANGC